MTAGEEDYPPPPRHRRPLSEPPEPGVIDAEADSTAEPRPLDDPSRPDDRRLGGRHGAPWFDEASGHGHAAMPPNAPMSASGHGHAGTYERQMGSVTDPAGAMGRPRMPGHEASYRSSAMPTNHVPPSEAPTGETPTVGGSAARSASSNAFDAIRSGPLPVVFAVAALVVLAGVVGWLFRGSGSGEGVTVGGDADEAGQSAVGQDGSQAEAELPPLSPAALPAANEEGLVGLELALIDPYTGTGSTGTAELYLNAVTGQVCHVFDAPGIEGRYNAYIHEAEFPKAGPIVVDLGEVENAVPRCVNASPIDLTRAMAGNEGFYVAAHAGEREIVLRAQLSAATTVFDNRDPVLVASAEAAAAGESADGDGDGLFGSAEEGAYLVVESGRVSFEGMVPDEETATELRAAFIALSGMGVEVVDNLMVQAGAPAPSGKVIVADALLFDSGQDQISGDPAVLATLADLMIVNPTWTMTITGHTDDVGPYSFNIELSLRRANNIRARLAELNVPEERIRVQGAGPEQPIDDNSTEEGRARNRRIEISIDS